MESQEMRRLVADARVARLATVTADGRPHLVPICFALLGDTLYSSVDHKPKRGGTTLRRIANLRATGRACVLVDEYREDWSSLWWVRLDGTGRVADDPAEVDAAVTALVHKYPQYADRRPTGPVVAVDVARWRGWRAS